MVAVDEDSLQNGSAVPSLSAGTQDATQFWSRGHTSLGGARPRDGRRAQTKCFWLKNHKPEWSAHRGTLFDCINK